MMQLLSMKELAWELNRSYSYICAMKKAGFVMPGGRATLEEAREWLRSNPDFSFAAVYVRKDFPNLVNRESKRRSRPAKQGQFPSASGQAEVSEAGVSR